MSQVTVSVILNAFLGVCLFFDVVAVSMNTIDYVQFRKTRLSQQSASTKASHRVLLSKLVAAAWTLVVTPISVETVNAPQSRCDVLIRLCCVNYVLAKFFIYGLFCPVFVAFSGTCPQSVRAGCAVFLFLKSRLVRPLSGMSVVEKVVGLATFGVPAFAILVGVVSLGKTVAVGSEEICSVPRCCACPCSGSLHSIRRRMSRRISRQ